MRYRFVLYFCLLFTLNACSLSPAKVPEEHFYRLSNMAELKTHAKSFLTSELVNVKANGIYNERAILYRYANKPLEIHRYNYHFWLQSPAQMLKNYMQLYLQTAEISTRLNSLISKNMPDSIIQAEIMQFERVLDKNQAGVDVAIKFTFAGHVNIYTAQAEAKGNSMYATINAFNKALSQVMDAFVVGMARHNKKLSNGQ